MAGVFLLGVVVTSGCGHAPAAKAAKPVEVVVTTPITGEVVDYEDFTGRLDAYRTVDIRARVDGFLRQPGFKEGDLVKKGQQLFLVEPVLYEVEYDQAKANVSLSIAERNLQEANAARARRLANTQAIAREEYDQIVASREKANATAQAAKAAEKKAEVNLGYTKVLSPIDGRISRRTIDPGNMVRKDETVLTTVVDDHLVYCYFDVDERTYLRLVGTRLSSDSRRQVAELHLPVLMRLANEDEFSHAGRVDFVDNRLNGNTGTIRLRGVFENPEGVLKAGLFARIRLPIGRPYRTTLIPDEALQSDQGRQFVYVVGADNKVEYRALEVGQAVPGKWKVKEEAGKGDSGGGTKEAGGDHEKEINLRVVKGKKGLEAGERVVVTGMQKVRPKQAVEAKSQPAPTALPQPEVKLLRQAEQAAKANDRSGEVRGE